MGNLHAFNGFASASRTTLAYLRQHFGFQLWMTTKTDGDDWIVLHTDGSGYPIQEGSVFRWADSFCARMVAGLGPRIAPSVNQIPVYTQAPIGRQLPIGSYIGVPIENEDGTLFGTLCAIDPQPQPESIVEQLPLIELLAQMLTTILASDRKAVEQVQIAKQAQRAKEQLQEELWRLESILKGTHVGSWEWNVQTGETVFNERWAEIIGYTLDELSPVSIETWIKFAHPDDLAVSSERLQQHFKGELDYYECESRMKHKDGHWIWVFDRGRIFSWTEDGKPLMMFGTHQDITDRKRAELALRESEERLQALASTDELTGLLNRRGWEECIATEESRAQRYNHSICVIVVDLDGLKVINDVHGHKAGDELIRRAAHCIQGAVRNVDKVARIGGDEFAILVVECNEEGAAIILKRVQDKLIADQIRASSGMAMRHPSAGLEGSIVEADRMMYEMKTKHRSQHSRKYS